MNRPVILIGNGIRNNPDLVKHLQSLNIPCLYTWMAADMGVEDDSSYCGRPGIFGMRSSNIIQQKATHMYVFGARLDGEQVAYNIDNFAPNAEVYVYEIDDAEFKKFPERLHRFGSYIYPGNDEWLVWCKALYNRFRPELDGNLIWISDEGPAYVNPFYFTTLLSEHSKPNDVFAIGSSGNGPTVFYQSYKVKQGQRISNVSTIGAMGADVPMALGAALATGRRTICVTGDGGIQMNAQELETIRREHLPVIFFVMSNGGYNSIRVGQKMRFGRVNGCGPASGLTFPSLENLAHTYGFMYMKLDGHNLADFHKCFTAQPLIVEVMVDPEWQQLPRVMSSGVVGNLKPDPMEDMTPKLDPAELERIMKE
jgi:acetolactate synthase-1/2/3 large subunit